MDVKVVTSVLLFLGLAGQRCHPGRCIDGVNSFTCNCTGSGYEGPTCQDDINECNISSPCQNNGTCYNGNGTYQCRCLQGFKGVNPCNNSGTCIDLIGNYSCQCTPFATGRHCETDINECEAKPCNEPHGVCVNKLFKEHQCFCADGFTGKDCTINVDECKQHSPCQNGATCKDKIADYECVCAEGWTGRNCAVDINECELGFCQNGATCKNSNGSYTCSCVPGYTDRNCSTDIDDCESVPCEHNSTCYDLVNDFNCSCEIGYTGKNCSQEINECLSDPCQNNGTCKDLIGGYNCSCTGNYTGIQCQYKISPCSPVNPCFNNGTCVEKQFNYTCHCQPGFTGVFCKNVTTLGLNGSSYMAVKTVKTAFVLSLQFRTTLATGLLAADLTEKLLLQLKRDHTVEVWYDGSPSVLSAGGEANLTNGLWHTVSLNISVDSMSLEIDNSSCGPGCFKRSKLVSPLVQVTRLYVGGFGPSLASVGNFTGCIQDVLIDERAVVPQEPGTVLFKSTVGCPRVEVCSPRPCVHGRCVDKWIEYECDCERPWAGGQCNTSLVPGTFGATASLNPSSRHRRDVNSMQNASFAKFLTSGTSFDNTVDLSFFIRTRAMNGLVTLFTDNNTQHVTVGLDSGVIFVEVNIAGAKSTVTLNFVVNDGNWHFVVINSNATRIDNQTFPGLVIPQAIALTHTYVGGLDNYSLFPSAALPSKTPFRGCIQDMRLNNKLFQFYPLSVSLDSYALLDQGHVGKGCPGQDVCGTAPCGNGGKCRDLWDKYRCDCYPRYGGGDCALYGCALVNLCPSNTTCVNVEEHYECVHPATFNGSSSATDYSMTSNAAVLAKLAFDLRTRESDTTVLETSFNGDKLVAEIKNGFLSVEYTLGGRTGNVTSGVMLSDGQWHKVRVNSSNNITSVTVDQQVHSSSGSFRAGDLASLLNKTKVVLGGGALGAAFKGCLNDVRVGGLLLPFIDYYNSSINVSHLTPLKPRFSADISNLRYGCHGDDTCAPRPCEHGACRDIWNDFACSCLEGWAGRWCNLTANMTCAHDPCDNNATCFNLTSVSMVSNETQVSEVGVDMFNCSCVPGFEGKICDTPTNECTPQPCRNGGNCTDVHLNYTCSCVLGFTGRDCGINIDDCVAHNCSNGAACVDGINSYNCSCAAGFNGTFCENDINECASAQYGPCSENGTVSCNNTVGNFSCVCKAGYFGRYCEHDPSQSCELLEPCVKGICSDNATDYYCNCSEGFSGKRCQVDIRECDDKPCKNNGTCRDSHSNKTQSHFAGYKCNCTVDYSGYQCEKLVDLCETSPCQNNASCVRLTYNSYFCNCTPGYAGKNCEVRLPCYFEPCQNGATCNAFYKPVSNYTCSCAVGFEGRDCEHEIDYCSPDPCKNNATCENKNTEGRYVCNCTEGYGNVNCSGLSRYCPSAESPCAHGDCVPLMDDFLCVCTQGYQGKKCDQLINRCDSNPCKNYGSCKSTSSGFNCTCTDDWIGKQCDITNPCKDSPCENSATCIPIEPHGNFSCACTAEFTGMLCETLKAREPEATTSKPSVGLIVGIIAACIVALILVVLVIIFIRRRADNGTYNPSKQEIDCGRVEMNPMLKPPPPERLI